MQRSLSLSSLLAGLLVMLVLPAGASAQDDPFRFELTPYGAYRFGGDFDDTTANATIDLDDAASFGIIFNAVDSANTQWEVIYSQQKTDADTSNAGIPVPELDVTLHYLQGGGTYHGRGELVRPFLAATVGGTYIDVGTSGYESDAYFSFSFGLGLQIRPNERFGIRLEGRAWGTFVDSSSELFCETSPANNICAITVDGSALWQFETLAGVIFRF